MALHLLDVNALIALIWEDHQFHATMAAWFARHAPGGWATCAITQSGFIRVMNRPALVQPARTVAELAEALAHNVAQRGHRLLPLNFGFGDVLACCSGGVVGHRQITDAYLLTAAVREGARLLTFDRGIAQLLATETERQRHVLVLG